MNRADPVDAGFGGAVAFPAGARALVTGATGFIGGRLVERLTALGAAEIRCPVRSQRSVARLAGGSIRAEPAELADAAHMARLIDGADYLFHCAWDIAAPQRNVAILRSLLEGCTGAAPRRFILTSSFSVYQPFPDGILTEQTGDGDRANAYVDVKLMLEDMVLAATREGRLVGTVIQPAIVYGPKGGGWTQLAAERLRTGDVVLPDDGAGLCNPVHVDDVVDAMLLAAVHPGAVGERFIVTGPEAVSWAEFHGRLAEEIGAPPPVLCPTETILAELAAAESAPALARPKRLVRRVLRAGRVRRLFERLPVLHALALPLARWAGLPPRERHLPERPILELYRARATASWHKAEQAIGFRPRMGFDRGMRQTGAWLRGEAPR